MLPNLAAESGQVEFKSVLYIPSGKTGIVSIMSLSGDILGLARFLDCQSCFSFTNELHYYTNDIGL